MLAVNRIALVLLLMGLTACSNFEENRQGRIFVFEPQWSRSTQDQEELAFKRQNRMSPIVAKDLVFVGNSIDRIAAYSRKTGDEVWHFKVKGGVEGGAALSGNNLLFGGGNGQFYSLQAGTGQVQWSFPLRAESLSAPIVDGKTVYHLAGDGRLYALDLQSGSKVWIYSKRSTQNLSIRASSRPLLYKNRLYVGFADGTIACLNPQNGGVVWEKNLGRGEKFNDVDSSPIIFKGKLFVSSFERGLFALDPSSGKTLWNHSEGSSQSIAGHGDQVFYASGEGKMQSIDLQSGKLKWQYRLKNGIPTEPVYYKGLVIFGSSSGPIEALDANSGKFVSHYNTGYGLKAAPRLMEKTGELFVLTTGANVFGFRLKYRRYSELMPWDKKL